MPIRLSQDQFEELVDQALQSLPEQFLSYMENVMVQVQDRPTRRLLQDLAVEPDMTLLGVYTGVPLTSKSVSAPVDWPEQIIIFQRNIEAVCQTPADVVEQVRKTVLHEIGHHFGMDEDDLDRLGYG